MTELSRLRSELPPVEKIEQILLYLYSKPFPEPHHSEVPRKILDLIEAWEEHRAQFDSLL